MLLVINTMEFIPFELSIGIMQSNFAFSYVQPELQVKYNSGKNSEIYDSVFVYHNTVELQRLEHQWLVYHGCFELVLESL